MRFNNNKQSQSQPVSDFLVF